MDDRKLYLVHRAQCISRRKTQLKEMVDDGIALEAHGVHAYWAKASDFKTYLEGIESPSLQERAFIATVEDNASLWLAWFPQKRRTEARYMPKVDEKVYVCDAMGTARYIGTIQESRYLDDKHRYGAFELEMTNI